MVSVSQSQYRYQGTAVQLLLCAPFTKRKQHDPYQKSFAAVGAKREANRTHTSNNIIVTRQFSFIHSKKRNNGLVTDQSNGMCTGPRGWSSENASERITRRKDVAEGKYD